MIMHRLTNFCALYALLVVAVLLAQHTALCAQDELKLEAQLIWGTNEAQSPDPNHKPAEPDVQKKLRSLPFKWTNYFEVNRVHFAVAQGRTNRVVMSKECQIAVKNLGNATVEVTLFGKGERVGTITQALPKGELLVTGGNAPNLTAWFVVLRQTD
jgi:acylphosphatase